MKSFNETILLERTKTKPVRLFQLQSVLLKNLVGIGSAGLWLSVQSNAGFVFCPFAKPRQVVGCFVCIRDARIVDRQSDTGYRIIEICIRSDIG